MANSLQVCAVRASELDATGAPVEGGTAVVLAPGVITATISPNFQDGEQLTVQTGCGQLCATTRLPDQLIDVNIDFTVCELDSELLALVTGSTTIISGGAGGTVMGHYFEDASACSTVEKNGVSLEFWSKAWESCSAPTGDLASFLYYRWVFPRVYLRQGDVTLENGFLQLPLTGRGEANGNWGDGPFNDLPAYAGASFSTTSPGAVFRDSTIPAAGTYTIPAQ